MFRSGIRSTLRSLFVTAPPRSELTARRWRYNSAFCLHHFPGLRRHTHTHSPSAFNTTAPPPGGEVLPLVEESEIRVSKEAGPQQSCSGQSLHQILLHLVLITAPSIPREQTAGGGASVGLFYHHIQTQDHKLTSHDVSPQGCGCSGSSCTRLEESRNILKKDQTPLSHDHTRLQFELVDHL